MPLLCQTKHWKLALMGIHFILIYIMFMIHMKFSITSKTELKWKVHMLTHQLSGMK